MHARLGSAALVYWNWDWDMEREGKRILYSGAFTGSIRSTRAYSQTLALQVK